MEQVRRNGFKWCVNEILRLQREYELLELSVEEIAELHERTISAILHKLLEEEFITSFEEAQLRNKKVTRKSTRQRQYNSCI